MDHREEQRRCLQRELAELDEELQELLASDEARAPRLHVMPPVRPLAPGLVTLALFAWWMFGGHAAPGLHEQTKLLAFLAWLAGAGVTLWRVVAYRAATEVRREGPGAGPEGDVARARVAELRERRRKLSDMLSRLA
jgi:hypothetical protein